MVDIYVGIKYIIESIVTQFFKKNKKIPLYERKRRIYG